MITSFAPSFQHFQKDIERFLKNEGKCEKDAFAPLVAEFRKWNWEWSYDKYLVDLTARLKDTGDWSLLKELWGAVIAKRILLDSLYRLRSYASELQQTPEVGEYLQMIARVEQRRKA